MKLQSFLLDGNLFAIFVKQAHGRARVLNFQKICVFASVTLFSLLVHTAAMAELKPVFTSKTPAEGKFQTIGIAAGDMVPYLELEYYDWLNQHFDIMQVYPPWFNDITVADDNPYVNGFVYKNMFSIYDCSLHEDPANGPVEPDDPNSICAGQNQPILLGLYEAAMQAENDPGAADWILKDADGNFVYNQFPDPHGRYSQLAADIRNPAFRYFWLLQMRSMLTIADDAPLPTDDIPSSLKNISLSSNDITFAYRGIFVDDVNLDLDKSISNGTCRLIEVEPKSDCDWSTDISPVEWAQSLVTFMQEIRATFPDLEIMHNSVWYHTGTDESYVNAQIQAADIITVERGVHDGGLNANLMPAFFAFNDKVHEFGRRISHYIHVYGKEYRDVLGQLRELEHGLAGLLLVSNGNDFLGADRFVFPGYWWEGFDVDLGDATTSHYLTDDGLYRRDFTNGMVLLNPNKATFTSTSIHISLPGYFRTLNGDCINEISLPAASGRVLFPVSSCTSTYSTDFTWSKTQ